MEKPELIAPAGDWVSLRAAISAGADGVYFGVKQLNMRANAKNFEIGEISRVVRVCHEEGVSAYLVLNTIIYDDEIEKVKKVLGVAKKAKVDGVVCWDYAVVNECEKLGLSIHLSTQSSVSNSNEITFLKNKIKKLERIVLARELSLKQIKLIINKIKKGSMEKNINKKKPINNKLKNKEIGIETFIHGAMCVSVSGRCFISQFLFDKSANRGDCLQPCRREYTVKDPEEGHKLKLDNNYVMSPKDLCCMGFIDKLIESGISAFKIEGRNRSPEYVRTVVSCYRTAIDAHFDGKLTDGLKKKLVLKLKTVYNRGFSSGFYLGKPNDEDWSEVYGSKSTTKKKYVGFVKNFYKKVKVAEIKLEAGDVKVGDRLMFQGPTTGVFEEEVKSMELNHNKVSKGKKGSSVAVKVKGVVRERDKVYLVVKS